MIYKILPKSNYGLEVKTNLDWKFYLLPSIKYHYNKVNDWADIHELKIRWLIFHPLLFELFLPKRKKK